MTRLEPIILTLFLASALADTELLSYGKDETRAVVDGSNYKNRIGVDTQGRNARDGVENEDTDGIVDPTGRILGVAPDGAYPFYGYLEGCGSSLIHPEFALTAAHCQDLISINQTIWFDDNSVSATVHDLIVHPKYDDWKFDYDLMLLRISPPITTVATIDINTDPLVPDLTETMIVIGRGFIPRNARRFLLEGKLTVNFPPRGCEGAYPGFDNDIMLCATQSSGETVAICRNDAGAIIDSRGLLVAIRTADSRCQSNVPWNTARVSEAADWIFAVVCHLAGARPEFCGSNSPSMVPSSFPSGMPTISDSPSSAPSIAPTETPSVHPSSTPSLRPTGDPTKVPSASPSSQPSIAPTVDLDCEDIYGVPFFVEHLNVTKDCRWLTGRRDDMLKLCRRGHRAFDICEDTCGKCADTCENANNTVILPRYPRGNARTCSQLEDRPRDWTKACGIPEIRRLCRDVCTVCPVVTEPPTMSPTLSPTTLSPTSRPTAVQTAAAAFKTCDDLHFTNFDVFGFRRTCGWLAPRVDRRVRDESEYRGIVVDEEIRSSTWRRVLCNFEHPAYKICEETCGACTDSCEDDDTVAVAFYDKRRIGRPCSWLRRDPRNFNRYCPSARNVCRETCENCE